MAKRSKTKDFLNFEITFYEELLDKYPDFVDALVPLGDAYTKKGFFAKGLAVDLKLTHLQPDEPSVWYNLSCSYARLNRIQDALDALQQSFRLGFNDYTHMAKDPDLEALRKTPQFKNFLESLISRQHTT